VVHTTLVEQILAGASAALIIADFPWSDVGGLVLAGIVLALNMSRRVRTAVA
jgi:hypothetical protein